MNLRRILIILILLAGCGGGNGGDATPVPSSGLDVASWAYWLDDITLNELEAQNFDLAVIDYSADGSEEGEFTSDEITSLKNSGDGKIVLAYMSIGEAEMGRFYFDDSWVDPDTFEVLPGAPDWLVSSNPDFPDNFKVQYWDEAWQTVIFGYLDRIIDAGFDGVYLDIIEAFEFFGPDGESGENRASAGADMINFVVAIADYARETRGVSDFLIFPQNGEAILDEEGAEDFLAAVNGIGVEDLYFSSDVENDGELDPVHTDEVLPYLEQFTDAGKTVLAIDYVQSADKVSTLYENATAAGFIPYASIRDLNELTVNAGFDP